MIVEISTSALDTIRLVTRAADPTRETGGALFGADASLKVQHALDPGPDAIHREAFFLRDRRHTELRAARLYEKDRSQWVGEWHTHPSGDLVPSELDLTTYLNHLRDPSLGFSVFVALICSPATLAVRAWVLEAQDRGAVLHDAALVLESSGPTSS